MTGIKGLTERLFGSGEKREGVDALEAGAILNIPCDSIRPNRAQPRADFDGDAMLKLALSIKRCGILQPLTVKKTDIDDIYEYELISGERRLRAARLIELYSVPCIVLEADEQRSAELAIIENLMREDLNMFELAYGLRNLAEDFGLTQEDIARRMSMSQSAVANKMRLLRLGYEEQRAILEHSLCERHARALLKLETSSQRLAAISEIVRRSMNVSEAERYIDRLLAEKSGALARNAEKKADTEGSGDGQEALKGIRRQVELLSRGGRHASMEVESLEGAFEVYIRIEK